MGPYHTNETPAIFSSTETLIVASNFHRMAKFLTFTLALLVASSHAAPPTVPEATPTCPAKANPLPSKAEIEKAVAGCDGVTLKGVVKNDIIDGICKPVTLLFARGTGETGNIGELVGPPFALALEKEFGKGNVAVQGVNDYSATTTQFCEGGMLTRPLVVFSSHDVLTLVSDYR